MSYKVKNREIQNFMVSPPLIFSNRSLPVKAIYWLSRLNKELNNIYKDIIEERNKFMEDLAVKNENGKAIIEGNQYKFPSEVDKISALRKVEELFDLESDIKIDKIKLNLNDLQNSISANEMCLLEPFIDFDLEEKK